MFIFTHSYAFSKEKAQRNMLMCMQKIETWVEKLPAYQSKNKYKRHAIAFSKKTPSLAVVTKTELWTHVIYMILLFSYLYYNPAHIFSFTIVMRSVSATHSTSDYENLIKLVNWTQLVGNNNQMKKWKKKKTRKINCSHRVEWVLQELM